MRASVDLLDLKERFISGKKVHCELYLLGEQGCLYTRSNMERFELNADGPGRYSGDASHSFAKACTPSNFAGPSTARLSRPESWYRISANT